MIDIFLEDHLPESDAYSRYNHRNPAIGRSIYDLGPWVASPALASRCRWWGWPRWSLPGTSMPVNRRQFPGAGMISKSERIWIPEIYGEQSRGYIYIYIITIYIYMYISLSIFLSISMYTYIYIYI